LKELVDKKLNWLQFKKLNWLQKTIILLLGVDNKPIKGRKRLEAMIFLIVKAWPFLNKSPYVRRFMKEVRL
jgi:hypothetical protein